MHRSINRDIYLAKAESKAGNDQNVLLKILSESPYRQHKRMVVKILNEMVAAKPDTAEA